MKKLSYQLHILFLVIILAGSIFAQDTTKSLAFKNNKPVIHSPYFYRPDLGYQIWQQFKLIREANSGDVLAQHELGLRYLFGDGIPADTLQAVYWIGKAAAQNLPSAMYNYAILLINGWGVDWNPFKAFKYFRLAAKAGMIQSQYVVGILYIDNLIVKRDFNYAYYWIKKSSDEGYSLAKDVVKEIEPKISQSIVDSITSVEENSLPGSEPEFSNKTDSDIAPPVDLVFIDFDTIGDTITAISDSMLIQDLDRIGIDSLISRMEIDSVKSLVELATNKNINRLSELAENGSPEALTLIGKLYEEGIYFKKNVIAAAANYFRALRLDSPRSPYLLYKLSKSKNFFKLVQDAVKNNNAEAEFIWYALSAVNFDNRIAGTDALKLLRKSADVKYIPAIIELGLNYYTGRYIPENRIEGLRLWQEAALLKSNEAEIRLISAGLFDNTQTLNPKTAFRELKKAADDGSVLAQVTLAYCYQNGIGTAPMKSETVHYFRQAAQRGNQYAYRELKKLYDEIRPNDPEFRID